MKQKLLSITLLAFMGATLFAATPYAYYPYYRNGANTPFAVPTDKGDADLTATLPGNRAAFVMLGSWFDQTNSGGAPSYAADEGFTIIAEEAGSSWAPASTNDRIVSETAANLNSAEWNYTTDVFSKRGQNLYYSVNFSAAGNYKIYLRHNENKAVPYTVTVFSKADMDVAIKTFTLNSGGMTTTADAFSTDKSTQYVSAGGGTSLWIKTVDAITIATPGDYVIKIDTKVGFRFNFGGFTIFPAPVAATAEISLVKPVAPGAAVAVNTVANLKALAKPAGANTISKVEFFEGINLLGQGTLVNGFYEFNWTPTVIGSYVITSKVTDSGANTATSTNTTTNLTVVSSLAYVTRAAWTDLVQAEDYDFGGSDYGAFYDKTSTAASAIEGYRTDLTDMKPGTAGQNVQLQNGGTGKNVAFTTSGEKLNYTIPDLPTGTVKLTVNYANIVDAVLKVSLNAVVLGNITLPNTTSNTGYLDGILGAIEVTGDADSKDDVLTFEVVSGGPNLDYFTLALDQSTQTSKLNASSLEVYPNPSQGRFTIKSGTNAVSTYRVMSLSGQELQTGNFIGQAQVTLNIDKGIYLLETTTLDNKSMQKIVLN